MRVDRTWTISFENQELVRLTDEIKFIQIPADLGWRPILPQIATSQQVTLPMRAVDRLLLELDMVRAQLIQKTSRQDFTKRFPALSSLFEEVNSLSYNPNRRSA